MIKELIEQQLLKEQEEAALKERSGKFSPSSFGRCYRMQVWNRQNEPATNPANLTSLKKFRAGQFFHDFVRSVLGDKVQQYEVCIELDDFKGYADIVLQDEVCDIKSIHSWGFSYLPVRLENVRTAKPCESLQVRFYARELNKPYWSLCFISKDDMRIEEYRLPLTEQDKKDVADEMEALRKYWITDLPPAQPRAYWSDKSKKFQECSYCKYLDKCIEVENKAGRKHYVEKDNDNLPKV